MGSISGLRRSKVRACLCEGICKTKSSFFFFRLCLSWYCHACVKAFAKPRAVFFFRLCLSWYCQHQGQSLLVLVWSCKGVVNIAQQWRSHSSGSTSFDVTDVP